MARHHCALTLLIPLVYPLRLTFHFQTQAIDDIYRTVSQIDDAEKQAEGKQIVEKIAKLKYEVQHDRPLTYAALPKRMPEEP